MQRNLATKIQAKRESGLTAVRLKRDPPVCGTNEVTGINHISRNTVHLQPQWQKLHQ